MPTCWIIVARSSFEWIILFIDNDILKRFFPYPDGCIPRCCPKFSYALLVNHYWLATESHHIIEGFSCKFPADLHGQYAAFSIAHNDCDSAILMFDIALTYPSDNMFILEIIFLLPISIPAAYFDLFSKIRYQRPILDGIAVVIGVENTRHSILAQKNQGISQRLEPIFHKGLQALAILCVVIIRESDCVLWARLDEGCIFRR